MKLQKNLALIVLGILSVLTIVWDITLHLHPVKTMIGDYLYNDMYGAIYGLGALVGFFGVGKKAFSSKFGKAIFFVSLGMLSYAIALGIWSYYNLILHVEIPYPSLADVFFLVFFIIPMAIGCFHMLSLVASSITNKHKIEAVVILLFASGLSYLIHQPDFTGNTPVLVGFFNIVYPMGDTVLLGVAFIILRVAGGNLHRTMLFFVIGLCCQVVADFLYTYRVDKNLYWNGDISDLLFTCSGIILTYSIIHFVENFSPKPVQTSISLS